MPALSAFLALAYPLLDRLAAQAETPAARLTPEVVHALRVALRRLRGLLAAFKPHLDETAVAALREELSWAHRRLAPARDWDVFVGAALTPWLDRQVAADAAPAGLSALRAAARARRADARAMAQEALRDRRYARLLLRFRFWLDALAMAGEAKDEALFGDAMRAALRKRHRQIAKIGYRKSSSDDELHRLRLRVKKLGDLTAFAKPLAQGARAGRYVRRLAKVQKALGAVQDAVVACDLATALAAEIPAASREAAQAFIACQQARIALQRRRSAKAWKELAALKGFWRKSS